METSLILARIFGIAFLVITIGILSNFKYYQQLWQDVVNHPAALMITAIMDLILGLIVINLHNYWMASWVVIITLLGWFLFIRGAIRLLIPQVIVDMARHVLKHPLILQIGTGIFLILGLVLTYFGFLGNP